MAYHVPAKVKAAYAARAKARDLEAQREAYANSPFGRRAAAISEIVHKMGDSDPFDTFTRDWAWSRFQNLYRTRTDFDAYQSFVDDLVSEWRMVTS